MLDRWTPVATYGDGNCMFRAVSLAAYGTQLHHMQLRLRTCLEVGLHRSTYDTDDSGCHELLKRNELFPPRFNALWHDLCTPGHSCCYVSLLALSAVLQLRICSYFPPLQATFVAALTMDIVGRDVARDARSIAVMWSTAGDVPDVGEVDINHVVALRRRALPMPPCHDTSAVSDDKDNDLEEVAYARADAAATSLSDEDVSSQADDNAAAAATPSDSDSAADSPATSPMPKRSRRDSSSSAAGL